MAEASFTKVILKKGKGKSPKANQQVTVHADLWLRDEKLEEEKGTAIWSTSAPDGFLFPAKNGTFIDSGWHGGDESCLYRKTTIQVYQRDRASDQRVG